MNKTVIDILVGGQYGSEAKGLIATHIAYDNRYDWLVSVNSAQAGHTAPYFRTGEMIVNRQLPSACINNHDAKILIGAGAIINPEVLLNEIKMLESIGIPIINRLHISSEATVIAPADIQAEKDNDLQGKIGSTCEGVGYALSRRMSRTGVVFKDILQSFAEQLGAHVTMINDPIKGKIFLEGSQGYALSTYKGFYPFCTARDTTSAAFLSYARLSPRDVRDVYGVFRTYPIRVGGNSGYMRNECDWETVAKESGYETLCERTTVTKRIRRVGYWDAELAKESVRVNGINKPVLTFVNYLDKTVEGVVDPVLFPTEVIDKICAMGKDIGGFWACSTDARNMIVLDDTI